MHTKTLIERKLRGIARSDIAQITACADSGTKDTKSQKVSCAVAPVGISVSGSGFTACTKVWKFNPVLHKRQVRYFYQVEVTFLGIKLNGKTADITNSVG